LGTFQLWSWLTDGSWNFEFWSSERQLGFTTVWSKWLASWTRVTIVLIHVPCKDTIHMQHPTMGLWWRGDPQNPHVEHEGHFSGIVETFIGEFFRSWSVDEVGTRKDTRSAKAWVAKDPCSDRSPKVPWQMVRAEMVCKMKGDLLKRTGLLHLTHWHVGLGSHVRDSNEGVFNWWKSLGFGTVAHFVVTWQIISNYRLIRLKRFSSL